MNVVSPARLGSGTHTSSDLEIQRLQSLDSLSGRTARTAASLPRIWNGYCLRSRT